MGKLHPAIELAHFGPEGSKPDLLVISSHDGSGSEFVRERNAFFDKFMNPEDSLEDMAQYLEIARDRGVNDLALRMILHLEEMGLSVDFIKFLWPRGIVDVNRYLFEHAFWDVWEEHAEKDPEFLRFQEDMRAGHDAFIELLRGYGGVPKVDMHSMGPYAVDPIAGDLRSYVEGFKLIRPDKRINIISTTAWKPNRSLLDAAFWHFDESEKVENVPYGAHERMGITTTCHLMDECPGEVATWDIPKVLIATRKQRSALAKRFADGMGSFYFKKAA
ncbi:hypothetical protein KKC94_03275 [Patescibacteria group bacterium]|nr:hypothetical protein [Patescibacteria group bacterium]